MAHSTLSELKRHFASKPKPAEAKKEEDIKKTYLTVPYYTPSDDVDVDNLTEAKKKELIHKHKLMGTGDPITISNITNRQAALKAWHDPADFTYDFGTSYKAWVYTWAYLTLTIIAVLYIHPLLAVPLAWKVGHNWGQYIGGLVFGKEDMKGKTMYRTA